MSIGREKDIIRNHYKDTELYINIHMHVHIMAIKHNQKTIKLQYFFCFIGSISIERENSVFIFINIYTLWKDSITGRWINL